MAITKEDVIEFISNMTVLELSELVKEFEEASPCQFLRILYEKACERGYYIHQYSSA